jgi:AraC-like DNA-binding protein
MLEFPMELVRRRQPHEDAVLRNILQARAQVRLVTAETLWASRVTAYLDAASPESLPDIAATARNFGMSERGLRRRLESEGRSFLSRRRRSSEDWDPLAHRVGNADQRDRPQARLLARKRFPTSLQALDGILSWGVSRDRTAAGGVDARRPAQVNAGG